MNDKIEKSEIRELEQMASGGLAAFEKHGDINIIEEELAGRFAAMSGNERAWLKWMLLLIAVGLAGVLYLISKPSSEKPPKEIDYRFAYYEAPPFVLSSTSRGSASDVDDLSAIRDAYKARDYTQVITLTEDIAQNVSGLHLYRAVALLETSRIKEALQAFENVSDPELADMKDWYQALALLRNDDSNTAQELLKEIGQSDHYKAQEARSLLELISREKPIEQNSN